MAQDITPYKAMRQATGLSIREVAKRADIHFVRLANIERGLTRDEESRLTRVLFEAIEEKGEPK